MPDRLLLRLAPDGGLTWLRQSASARAPIAVAGVPPTSAIETAGEIVVLVPSEDVLLTQARVTARNRAQLLQALPFAVEDQLLAPVEDLHFAASRTPGEAIGVAVVAKETMRGWLARLASHGIQPDVLLPESLALPVAPGQAHAYIEDSRAIVRLAPWSAFACNLRELPEWLAQLQAANALESLDVDDFRAAPALSLGVPVAAYHERQRDPLAALARGATSMLNLLDGEFATSHRHASGARGWRIAALLAAAVIVLALVDLGADVWRLSRASSRLDVLAQEELHKAFPDIDAAQLARLSPQQLMSARLDRVQGNTQSGGLLQVLNQIGPIIAHMTRIQTRGIEYRNGTLELALRSPDVAMLDLVREQLAALPGLKAEMTAANQGAEGVDGRIRISYGDTAASGAKRDGSAP